MAQVTGTGCMLGAVTAAFNSCGNAFNAASAAAVIMGIAGEMSENAHGIGSFRTMLFDSVFLMSESDIENRIKIKED